MRARPADLSDRRVAGAAARSWGLRGLRLRHLPLGGGSHHWSARTADGGRYFLNVDDLHAKPWLGADPGTAFGGLRAAYNTAAALRSQAGLPFVAAPLPAPGGEIIVRVTARYSLAVFPFIDGRAGRWGRDLTPRERERLSRLLAELHMATPAAGQLPPRRGLGLDQRPELDDALGDLAGPWAAGPLAEPARRLLAAHAQTVATWLRRYDELARQVPAGGATDVVTHGEPHPGNFIGAAGRCFLVDWDTVALAAPERDLWMLDDGTPGAFAAYTAATGREVSRQATLAYRLGWVLADVAAFTSLLRSAPERTADTDHAWAALRTSLSDAQARAVQPYRHVS